MSTHGITFGKVVAAAGIAVGAVLLCSALPISFDGLGDSANEFFKNIGGRLSHLFSGDASITLSGGQKALLGAGVAAGGYALMGAMKDREEELKDSQVASVQPVEGGFAEKIAMDRAMMRCRAAMASQSPQFCAGAGRM